MSHDGTSRKSFRPKPNEGHSIDRASLEQEEHQFLKNALHVGIDGPVRKTDSFPISKVYSLEMLTYRHGEKWPHRVVNVSKNGTRTQSFSIIIRGDIAFITQIGGDFGRVEWEP